MAPPPISISPPIKRSSTGSSSRSRPKETVNFNQPSATSVTLNRVIGNEKSVIEGALNANGQVFIVNSAGVVFTKSAQVNVGGLVASTLDISNSNFLAGKYQFSGNSNASVVNLGNIQANPGGYVALLGNTVSNQGTITATLGTVADGLGQSGHLEHRGQCARRCDDRQGHAERARREQGRDRRRWRQSDPDGARRRRAALGAGQQHRRDPGADHGGPDGRADAHGLDQAAVHRRQGEGRGAPGRLRAEWRQWRNDRNERRESQRGERRRHHDRRPKRQERPVAPRSRRLHDRGERRRHHGRRARKRAQQQQRHHSVDAGHRDGRQHQRQRRR